MSIISKIKEKLLSKSDTYNFYKNEYYKNEKRYKQLNDKFDKNNSKYKKELKKQKQEFNRYVKKNQKLEKSNHNLFNTLFLYYELTPKGLLKDVQQFCIELLDFVDLICKKHDINYWLDYGSLLGAVRHGGFIPWDDDMDVGMVRKDYEKFMEVVEMEVKKNNLDEFINISTKRVGAKGHIYTFLQLVYTVPIEGNSEKIVFQELIFSHMILLNHMMKILVNYMEKKKLNSKIILMKV